MIRHVVLLFSILSIILTLTALEQQRLNEQLIENEVRTNEALHAQSLAIAQVQRIVAERENEIQKLQCQIDLMTAASRSSWGAAHRLMRAVRLDGCL